MTHHEAQQFADSLFAAFIGCIIFLFWLAFAVSTARSLKRIRQEAEKQTDLLQEIARNTRPPASPGSAAKQPSSLDYGLREPKSNIGTVVLVLGAVAVILFFAAILRK